MAGESRNVAVLGLGSFGSSIANELAGFGDRVLGIDIDEARVSDWSDVLSDAVIADARDERALREAGIADYDAVVVAMADSLECSILAVMAAQTLKVEHICAKAASDTHARILKRLGVHQVVHPEREFGAHIAHTLHNPAVCAYARLSDELYLAQIRIADKREGDTIASMKLAKNYDLQCVGRISDGMQSLRMPRNPWRKATPCYCSARAITSTISSTSCSDLGGERVQARRRPAWRRRWPARQERRRPWQGWQGKASGNGNGTGGPGGSGGVRRVASNRRINVAPAGLLVLSYLTLILIGSGLLLLPWASPADVDLSFSDAFFMATSGVTVTGLIVVDTAKDLTFFGQFVIAALIQLGGLGLMTFAVLILLSLGASIGMSEKLVLQDDLGQTSVSNLMSLVKMILKIVVVCEGVGVVVMAWVFIPDHGWLQGLWHAVFHSISAFNNAGFSTFSDSLVGYATNPLINGMVTSMFMIGGLGFVVLHDIFQNYRWRTWSLHTKLMLTGTLGLIVVPLAIWLPLEWHNPETLGQFSATGDRLLVGWFQIVTTRTAGFNTINTAAMTDASSLLTVVLMVIGGGTTSTAGGIKVTTFILLLLATRAFFMRQSEIQVFNRSVPFTEMVKVLALVTTSLMLIIIALFALVLTQSADFLDILFEVASAFGTVGLSQGVTGTLDTFGRGVICLLMFLGRVGPLILGFFLATHAAARVRYPSTKILLG